MWMYHGYEWWCFQQICGDWCLHYSGTALEVQLVLPMAQAWYYDNRRARKQEMSDKKRTSRRFRRDFGAAMEPKFACSTPRTIKNWKKQIVLLQHLASPWKKSSTSPMICLCPNDLSQRSCLPKHILSAKAFVKKSANCHFCGQATKNPRHRFPLPRQLQRTPYK